ncbi:nitrilase-related carbon-nitrogen hydrolase [Butyrivibrio sp. AD3002]|uniref:nitrilase-related carbon-nitrogen hydrolase n=1 Tax=Butyrivibrio sp. AD3002 TaxID=1280670 RepID=UPI0009DBD266|nr:nitrilase-related carbon-nitrogen hydrolase [Butyrivibrio sp. AD3002]
MKEAPKENLEKGIAACRQAKEKGADIAIFPEMWSCGYNFPHDADSIRECAISYDSLFVNRFSELAAELDMAIATCNYPAPHPDCNGHSTLFDGVAYLPELSGSRDTCVFEAPEEEGVYVAELDLDMLRDYRHREVWGHKHRRPELYGIIAEE